jgi:hypothetical protein
MTDSHLKQHITSLLIIKLDCFKKAITSLRAITNLNELVDYQDNIIVSFIVCVQSKIFINRSNIYIIISIINH